MRSREVESTALTQAPRVHVYDAPLSTEMLIQFFFTCTVRHQSCTYVKCVRCRDASPGFGGMRGQILTVHKWSIFMRPAALAAILASTTILSGCAGTIAGVSLSSLSSFAGFASTLFTGADLGEHAASLLTGKDCRFSEGLMRDDRDVCEEPGSLATRDDFHGIFVERIDTDGTIIYAAPKYMVAGVGAGENENNPDVVWAQIKAQKVVEEGERQLARAESNLQINVAALASGSLSPESLGFLPSGVAVAGEDVDGETASQTATRPRPIANAAQSAPSDRDSGEPVAAAPTELDQPALDERSFTASLQFAGATGQGGPFIPATTNSTPVVSTLVNGEPIVVMRIGPVMNAVASAPSEHFSALPLEPISAPQSPSFVTQTSDATSPQAIISSIPKAPKIVPVPVAPAPEFVDAAPSKPVSRPRNKPNTTEIAAATPKPAKPKETAAAPVVSAREEDDVYRPPSQEVFDSPAPDLTAPQPAPVAAPEDDSETAATSGPAPLVPLPQP